MPIADSFKVPLKELGKQPQKSVLKDVAIIPAGKTRRR